MNKLTWFNAEYMRKLPFDAYLRLAIPWFEKVLDPSKFNFKRLAELLQNRTEVLNQIPEMIDFLGELPAFDTELYTHKKMKTNPEVALDALNRIKPVLDGISDWTEENLHAQIMTAIEREGLKNGQVLWPLRIAISGKASTPGGAIEIAYLLGKQETLTRLSCSIAQLEAHA